MNIQVFIVLVALTLSSCGQRRIDESSTIALTKQDSSSVSASSQFEGLHDAGEPDWHGGEEGSAILGDVAEERYLMISSSRVESVGVESVFFYDITGDGVPELWMVTDDCEALRMVLVYSLSDWGRELYRGAAGHSLFFAGKDYVIRQSAHMGNAYWLRLQWCGGRMVSEIVFEEFTGGDYLQPAEDPVEELLPEDLNPCNLLNWVR
jgi:hypothetical protein